MLLTGSLRKNQASLKRGGSPNTAPARKKAAQTADIVIKHIERQKELDSMRAILDKPGGFNHIPLIEAAGIKIRKEGRFSEIEPEYAVYPENPTNIHYNQAGTLLLEKYLQEQYPELRIRIDTIEELKKDMSREGNPDKYVGVQGCRLANDDLIVNRKYQYFRASGGVDYVWRDPLGDVNSFSARTASGMSVRFRHG